MLIIITSFPEVVSSSDPADPSPYRATDFVNFALAFILPNIDIELDI